MSVMRRTVWSSVLSTVLIFFFFFQAEDGIRDKLVTGVQTCALPISAKPADAPLRVLPAQRQAGPRAARRGGALSSGQRRGARAPELDGRRLRAGHVALRGPDGELRLLARRGRAQPRALLQIGRASCR